LDYSQPIHVRTDASTFGVGGYLFQFDSTGDERPVAYVSRAFSDRESRWSTIEQEAFAIVFTISKLQHYLLGQQFILETDHANLQWLSKATAAKLVRWRLFLQQFDFSIRHIAGSANVLSDAFSRCFAVSITPAAVQDNISKVHNIVVGHRGVEATLALLNELNLEWDSMRSDVTQFIAACPICQKLRHRRAPHAAAFGSKLRYNPHPWHSASIDTVGPLPQDDFGFKHIIVIIDSATKYAFLYPARDATAQSAAHALLALAGLFRMPAVIRSDNGPQFIAAITTALADILHGSFYFVLPHRPQNNGEVERANQELLRHLRASIMASRRKSQWSVLLPVTAKALNNTVHSATGLRPNSFLGILSNVSPLFDGTSDDADNVSPVPLRDLVKDIISLQHTLVDERTWEFPTPAFTAENFPFAVDDLVLVSYPTRPVDKLTSRWRGPLRVTAIHPTTAHVDVVSLLTDTETYTYHLSRLVHYNGSESAQDPTVVATLDKDEFLVDRIVDHRPAFPRRERAHSSSKASDFEYLVSWFGFPPSENTWEPYSNISNVAAFRNYANSHALDL
jgi:hypothetical protein